MASRHRRMQLGNSGKLCCIRRMKLLTRYQNYAKCQLAACSKCFTYRPIHRMTPATLLLSCDLQTWTHLWRQIKSFQSSIIIARSTFCHFADFSPHLFLFSKITYLQSRFLFKVCPLLACHCYGYRNVKCHGCLVHSCLKKGSLKELSYRILSYIGHVQDCL